jgi:hypothetical protein
MKMTEHGSLYHEERYSRFRHANYQYYTLHPVAILNPAQNEKVEQKRFLAKIR